MHADHYFGLLRLMELRKEVMAENREPLIVLCPKSEMKSWLFFYDNQVDAIHDDLIFIDNRSLVCGIWSWSRWSDLSSNMLTISDVGRRSLIVHFETNKR